MSCKLSETVYIAGPITGDPNYRDKFAAAEQALSNTAGVDGLFNPAEIFRPLDEAIVCDDTILACCLKLVERCSAIALLPGWQKSKGAKAELRRYRESKEPRECVFFMLDMYPKPGAKGQYSTIITRYDGLKAWMSEQDLDLY